MRRIRAMCGVTLIVLGASCEQRRSDQTQAEPSGTVEAAAPDKVRFRELAAPSLEWQAGMRQSVAATFGDLRASYFDNNRLLGEQVIWGINLPERPVPQFSRLDDGNILIVGCRHHSCGEKGAVVATPQGAMIAAGLINYRCVFDELLDRFCLDSPRLTTFVKKENDRPEFTEPIDAWAKLVSVEPYPPIALREKVHIDDARARPNR
jgi:hypothetical protein